MVYKSYSFVAVACFLPGWAKDLSAPRYYFFLSSSFRSFFLNLTSSVFVIFVCYQVDLYLITHKNNKLKKINASCVIRTHNPSKRSAADLRHRLRGHRDNFHEIVDLKSNKSQGAWYQWFFTKRDLGVWTGWSWLRIGTGGGNLWMRYLRVP